MQATQTRIEPAVEVSGLSIGYDRQPVLEDISISIPAGQIIGLIGPNGAGKSTLLKTLAGVLKPRRGTIRVLGQPYTAARHHLAYVPQRGAVDWNFPVSVSDVVMMGRYALLGIRRSPSAEDHAIVRRALAQVEMSELAERQIGQLSGGQQQRVFVARALAQGAQVLLLDEPLNGIDVATQETILRLLDTLKAAGRSILMATHDLNSAAAHCDSLICLNRRVIAYGSAADVLNPAVLNVTYGGRMVLLHSTDGAHIMLSAERND